MPKIVINEYDLTKAGTGDYRNFSVVVPGFLAEDKYVLSAETMKYELSDEAKAVFDENGVYECSSIVDFENNIGKRAATITTCYEVVGATPPTPTMMLSYNPNLATTGAIVYTAASSSEVAKVEYQSFKAYVDAFNQALKGEIPAIPAKEEDFDPAKTMTVADLNLGNDATLGVYHAVARQDIDTHVGKLLDKKVQYVKVDAQASGSIMMPEIESAIASETLELNAGVIPSYTSYYIIDSENVGVNGEYLEDRISHYGNQMAYELIGMGYTVLFKAMTEYSKDDFVELFAAKGEDGEPSIGTDGNYTFDTAEYTVPEYKDIDGAYVIKPEYSAINQLSDSNFWECLKDKSTYDFRYLVTGLLTYNDGANKCILEVADHTEEILLDDASIHDGRGDCIALIDLDSKAYAGKTQSAAIPEMAKEAAKYSSAYAAVFAPYVTYLMADDAKYDNNKTFPASFHYLACAANSAANNFSEWYANAGYTRGVAKYTIESTGCKFGEIAIQSLEPRFLLKVGKELNEAKTAYVDVNTSVAVNLIVKIKSSYYLWGNRTGKKLGTRGAADGDLVAQHFLNIRQLCSTIKKQVYTTCRSLTFDPNSNTLWLNFYSLIAPMLDQMKADQGIKDYEIIKNATDRKALLSAKIRIVPIEAVEDFEIGLYLEDSLEDVALTEA